MNRFTRPESKQPIPSNAQKVFDGVIFDVYQWEQELFDGTKAIFEKLTRPDTVNVFPITPEGKIILTKQEQPGIAPFIGCAGGFIEAGEDIMTAAFREMVEETGYETNTLELWYATQPSSKIEWCIYTFIARNSIKTREISPDAGERIEVFEASFEEFVDICCSPDYRDTEIALKILRASKQPEELTKLKRLFMGEN